jgi:DNA-binding IclR family transcriptional regulator
MAKRGDTAAREPSSLELLDKTSGMLTGLEGGALLTVPELAAGAGVPVSSAYRLVRSLLAMGVLDRAPARGRYRLGLFALSIGAVVEERVSLRDAAWPHLDRLRLATRASAFLLVRNGTTAVLVDRLPGRGAQASLLPLGGSLPLGHGAAPRAILAHLPEPEREAVIEALQAEARRDPAIPARSRMEYEAERDRARGYTVADADRGPGAALIGAPLFNHRGEVIAAISVGAVRAVLLGDEPASAAEVMAAAKAISGDLGWRPPAIVPVPAAVPAPEAADGAPPAAVPAAGEGGR